MDIKLSIAIPTYNGEQYIRETLDSIVSQLEEGMEIVVSDNASTDGTADIIREYQTKYPVIRYFCNNENLGMDRNFDLSVRRSKGEYVWLFSDDDKMVYGGIRKVLEVLRDYKDLSAVFVNWGSYSDDFMQCHKERVLDIREDLFCRDSDSFLFNVRLNSIFISANVVRRLLYIRLNHSRYVGSNWLHVGALLAILRGHTSYCISTPYVMYRHAVRGWKDNYSIHLENSIALAEIIHGLSITDYSRKSVDKALKVIVKSLPSIIHNFKDNKLSFNLPILKRMILEFKDLPFFWVFCIPLILLPSVLHRIVIRRIKKIRKVILTKRALKKSEAC